MSDDCKEVGKLTYELVDTDLFDIHQRLEMTSKEASERNQTLRSNRENYRWIPECNNN